jgi:cell wall-associated NlpC family hydrolase
MTPEQQTAVVVEARSWLNTPWHHMARVKGHGVDCAMFLAEVYERAGLVPHLEPEYYPQQWYLHRSEEVFLQWVEKFASGVDDPQPGDVALYNYGRCVSHGAIIVEWPNAVIHAFSPAGRVVMSHAFEGEMERRFVGVWRLRG